MNDRYELEARYLHDERMISEGAQKVLFPLLVAPGEDISKAIDEAMDEMMLADRQVTQAARRSNSFYYVMAMRLKELPRATARLCELKPAFDKGDASDAVEAVAHLAFVKGICGTIGLYVNNFG